MNHKEAAELLPVIQAFAEGKTIEMSTILGWASKDDLNVDLLTSHPELFRIKLESKYRPFANAEECWNEMQKHEPFGWIKFRRKEDGYIHFETIRNDGIFFDSIDVNFKDSLDYYTFIDGSPFGIEE